FMILPIGAPTLFDAVRMGSEVFHTLKKALAAAGHNTNVGDEGGFAPDMASADEALEFVVKAIEDTGYQPGTDIALGLDPATSEFYRDGVYDYAGEGVRRGREEHIAYLLTLVDRFPIISIEDPMAEDDYEGWKELTRSAGDRIQLVGDDVFCTDVARLRTGI